MSELRVNRDEELEARFWDFKRTEAAESIRMDALWMVWLDLRRNDLKSIRVKHFKIILACLMLAEQHFGVATDEEREYFNYVKWFTENRIINTGTEGFARCERSPIFVRPQSAPRRIYLNEI